MESAATLNLAVVNGKAAGAAEKKAAKGRFCRRK
jgi:hypothetical protein